MRKREKLLLEHSADEIGAREVFGYLEIAFITSIFVVVLYLLYPKGMLKKQVLEERSNYTLTAIYLNNMLKLEPNNKKLIFATAEVLIKERKLDLAKELIDVLKRRSKGTTLHKSVYFLDLELLKAKKDKLKSKKEILKIDKELIKLLESVVNNGVFDEKDSKKWYEEAISLKNRRLALEFLKPLNRAGDVDSLEKCVYISSELKNVKREMECLERLIIEEKEFPKKWILALYSLYFDENQYQKAYALAKRLAKTDPLFKTEPARVALLIKDYRGASIEYMKLYSLEKIPEKKVDYLFKAISALREGGYLQDAVGLAERYQSRYIDNDVITKRFLNFYLSISNIKLARDLAVRILNIELTR